MKTNLVRQVIFPLAAAMIWGTAFVAQSVCAPLVPPFAFNALRSVIAVAFLIPVSRLFDAAAAKRGEPPPKTNWKALALGGVLCGICLSAAANLQQAGMADASAGKAGFVTAFYVVLVPVFGLFCRKRAGAQVWAGVAFAVAGLYLLCIPAGERFILQTADVFLVLCAVAFAAQIMVIDHFVQTVDGIKLSIVQFAVTAVISAVLALVFERVDWGGVWRCALPILYMGVMSSGVAYTLQILAQAGSNPAVVSLLFSLESVFSVLAGAVLLGDKLSGREYFGCALMFAAVVLAQIPHRNRKKLASAENV